MAGNWVLLLYFLSTINTEGDVTRPYGSIMCVKLCSNVGWCDVARFNEIHLICLTRRIEHRQSKDFLTLIPNVHKTHKKAMKVSPKLCMGEYRMITSRRGTEVRIASGQNNSQLRKVSPLDENRKRTPTMANVVTSFISSKSCFILSMTPSWENPDVLFALIECMLKSCYRLLAFVDIPTGRILNNTLTFCEKAEDERQIFVAPCVKDLHASCLFSVNVGTSIAFTSYSEPNPESSRLTRDAVTTIHRHYFPFVCSVYRGKEILCIANKHRLCQVRKEKGRLVMYILRGQLNNYEPFKDFTILDASPNPTIVSLYKGTAKVHRLIFEKRKIETIGCVKVDRYRASVTWAHELLLFHAKRWALLFYHCYQDDLYACK